MRRALETLVPILIFLLLWEIAARILNDALSLPTFSAVLNKWVEMLRENELLPHVGASMQRALGGFALAAIGGEIGRAHV